MGRMGRMSGGRLHRAVLGGVLIECSVRHWGLGGRVCSAVLILIHSAYSGAADTITTYISNACTFASIFVTHCVVTCFLLSGARGCAVSPLCSG
jgi:hypothetical protein